MFAVRIKRQSNLPSLSKLYSTGGWLQEEIQALEEGKSSCLGSYDLEKLLQTCGRLQALEEGRRLHAHIAKCGFGEHRLFLENHLLSMYAKCGSLEETHKLLCSMPSLNVVSWNAVIGGYAQNGYCKEALEVYQKMQLEGTKPSRVTFTNVLSACANPECFSQGVLIHACIMEVDPNNVVLENGLVNMYGKCGSLNAARAVFDVMRQKTVVSWNSMIAAYAQFGYPTEAFYTFRNMQLDGTKPSNVTFLGLLNTCLNSPALEQVRALNKLIVESGLQHDILLVTCLITTYGRCGSMSNARRVFSEADKTNVVSWNAMLTALAEVPSDENAVEAVLLLKRMLLDGLQPVKITFISLLNACSSLKDGVLIHNLAADIGLDMDFKVAVALSTMYTRAGSLSDANRVLNQQSTVKQLDVVSWTSLITTCSQNGLDREALKFLRQMQLEGTRPNNFTLAAALDVSAKLLMPEEGKKIYHMALENQVEIDEFIVTGLINLYGKSGKLSDAQTVFDDFKYSTLVLTTALIAAYSQHGYGNQALEIYRLMQMEGQQPNDVTFVTILSACSHAGLLHEGIAYFKSMTADHAIPASGDHYRCMVDLFGRLGHLADAEEIINRMPFQPGTVAWLTLLGANSNHGNLKQGEHAIEQLAHLKPTYTKWRLRELDSGANGQQKLDQLF